MSNTAVNEFDTSHLKLLALFYAGSMTLVSFGWVWVIYPLIAFMLLGSVYSILATSLFMGGEFKRPEIFTTKVPDGLLTIVFGMNLLKLAVIFVIWYTGFMFVAGIILTTNLINFLRICIVHSKEIKNETK